MKRLILIGLVGLMGCVTQTGVVPIGQDTYLVARQGWIATQSVAELKGQAFMEAGAYCVSKGRQIQPVSYKDTPGVLGRSFPESEVQFRCLLAGDPELSRPQRGPDAIIENRNR